MNAENTYTRGGLLNSLGALGLLLAQIILTMSGIGSAFTTGLLGAALCVIGFTYKSADVDIWILGALIIYTAFSFASAYAAHGNMFLGYGALQFIFPLIYLLLGSMDATERLTARRLFAAWAAVVALLAIIQYLVNALIYNDPARAEGLLGNPNALGIFLVISWLGLSGSESFDSKAVSLLRYSEPLLLCACALTLSLGSFAAMACGIAVKCAYKFLRASKKEGFAYLWVTLAKAALCMGTGIMIYLCAVRTAIPSAALAPAAYAALIILFWDRLERFFNESKTAAVIMALIGVAGAFAVVFIRRDAGATFSERLDMMESAAKYAGVEPILGVGPFNWRLLDMSDGGTYFNTWHVHNIPLHIAVETGFVAAAALIAIVVGYYIRKHKSGSCAAFTAFTVHNIMDTSFFYPAITVMTMTAAAEPKGKTLKNTALKILYSVFLVLSLCTVLLGAEP